MDILLKNTYIKLQINSIESTIKRIVARTKSFSGGSLQENTELVGASDGEEPKTAIASFNKRVGICQLSIKNEIKANCVY